MTHVQPVFAVQTSQPLALNPFHQLNSEWNVGFCDCCDDVSECCYALFCWQCFMCSLAGKLNESKCSYCCLPYAIPVYRMKMRSILRIKGDSCKDFLASFFCPLCAGLQMNNELRARGIA